jgi:hypothetical protein
MLRRLLLFAVLAGIGVGAYVGLSTIGGPAGFPLDDAWIHQTYARNLAESGQMAYLPGQPSAGSTSPLWTLIVSAGYKLNLDYRWWTYAIGAASLALCAWLLSRLSLRQWPDRPGLALAAGLACLFEWHLVWAAASGMETVLFAALALALVDRVTRSAASWRDGVIFGAMGGLLTLTRPEGLLLVALGGMAGLPRLPFVVASIAGFVVPVLPAAWLNLQAGGTLFPNTFYAKQQEYAVYFSSLAAWLPRALDVIGAPFAGAQVILVPGFLIEAGSSLRRAGIRAGWLQALPIVWVALHLAVYALRLPVTYQHGRYLIPIIPVILLYGLHGSARLIERVGRRRILRKVAAGSLIGVTAALWIAGAGAYRADVNIVENELVASARWIDAHTPPGALIAAHDIGAIGYFARRPLLDLAGLVSPQVIPVIRDEVGLLALMRARGTAYFAAPPDFYTTLLTAPELEPVFAGSSPFAPRHWSVFRTTWR